MSLTARRLRAAVVVLGAAAAVGIVGPVEPAAADDLYCGRHWVLGEIDADYRRLGGPGGVLGCPVTDELGNPDGEGRRSHFEHGAIYWTPSTGAHEVHGAIHDKWAAMGWEAGALGYPLSDEITNPDGVGKRSQFEGGTVYWHPDTGAHAVWGAIGSAWGSMGWEGGRLGYPITDELGSPDGVGRYSDFQRGTIYWGEGFTCTVDGAAIPGDRSAAWGFARETGQRRCGESWRRVVPLLVGGRYGVTSRVDVVVCTTGDCPGVADADAGANRIRVNSGYVNDQPADWGMISHEQAHIVQAYSGDPSGWVTEGIADWVRYSLGQPPPNHGQAATCQGGAHYTDGYECAAALLTFMDARVPGPLVQDLNLYMRQQGPTANVTAWITTYTRDTLASHWLLCRSTTCTGGAVTSDQETPNAARV